MQRSSMLLRILFCLTFVVALSIVQGRPASENSENDGYYETTYYYTSENAMEESESSSEKSDDSSWSYSSSGSSWSEGQSEDEFSNSQKGQKGSRAKEESFQMKEMSYESEGGSSSGSGGSNTQTGGNGVDNASSGKSSKDSSSSNSYSSGGGYEEIIYSSQEFMSEAEYDSESKSGSRRRSSSSMSRSGGGSGNNNDGSQSTDVAKGGSKNEKSSRSRSGSETRSRTSEEESSFDSSSTNQRSKQSSRQSTGTARRGVNDKDQDSSGDDLDMNGNGGKSKGDMQSHKGKTANRPNDKTRSDKDKSSHKSGKQKISHKTGSSYSEHESEEDDSSDFSESKRNRSEHHHKSTDISKIENGDDKTKPKPGKPGKDSNAPGKGDHPKGKPKDSGKPEHGGKKSHGPKDKPKPGDKAPSDKPGKKKPHKPGGTYTERSSQEDDSSEFSESSSRHTQHKHKSSEKSEKGGKPGDKTPHHKPGHKKPSDDDNDYKKPGKKPNKPSGEDKSPHDHGKKPGHPKDDDKTPGKKPGHPKDDDNKPGKKSGHPKDDDKTRPKPGKPGNKTPHHKPGHKKPSDDDNDDNKPGKKPRKPFGEDKSPHDHGKKPGHPKDDDKKPGKKPGHPKDDDKKPGEKPGHPKDDDNKPGKKPGHPKDDDKTRPKPGKPGKTFKCRNRGRGDSPEKGNKHPHKDTNTPKRKKHKNKKDTTDENGSVYFYSESEEDDSFDSSETTSQYTHYYHESSETYESDENSEDSKDKPKQGKKKPTDKTVKNKKTYESNETDTEYNSEEDDSSEISETRRQHTSRHHKSSNKSGRGVKPGDKYPKKKPGNKESSDEDEDDMNNSPGKKPSKPTEEKKRPKHHKPNKKHGHPKDKNSKKKKGKGKEVKPKNKPHGHKPDDKKNKNYPGDKKSKPKNKKPTKVNKNHPTRQVEKDSYSYNSSEEDDNSDSSINTIKNRRHKHKSTVQKGKGDDKYSKHKHGTRKTSDDEGDDNTNKQGRGPSKDHKNNKPDKHKDSEKKGKGFKGKNTHVKGKHDKTNKKRKNVHKDRKTPNKDKNKHRPSKDEKKPKKYHHHTQKTGVNSYHSSEEFDSSDESDNNVRRKRHERRSYDRRGTKGDKKHHGHPKHKDVSKKKHKDDKMKPKHKHDHKGKKGKHWNKNRNGSDSDEVDKKKGKHIRHNKDHKQNNKGGKHHHPGGDKKRTHKNKPSKHNDKNHRGSRHNHKGDKQKSHPKQTKVNYGKKYKEIKKFLENLTLKNLRKDKNVKKKFHEYFNFYVKTESVFKFIKFCFLYSEAPKNFEQHFTSILETILEKKFDEVPDDYYIKFITKVSGKNRKDFGKKYKKIQQFLQDLTFEDIQTEENMKTFYNYFKFKVKSEIVFKFIKKCFRSPKKPAEFDTKFSSIWHLIINTKFSQIIEKHYTIFANFLFGKNHKGNQNNNKHDDNSNSNNNKNEIDFESKYEEIHQFLDDLTFEKIQSDKKLQKTLYRYFRINIKSKSMFKFIKFCFQYSKKPTGFGKNFSTIYKIILKKKMKDIPDDYYTKFITKVFGKNKKDFGKKYKQIQQFLQDLTFEDLQTEENMETFYSYFNFYVESEDVFKFMKECFRSPKKPAGFDTNFSSIWNIIINTDFNQVIDEYYTTYINIIYGNNGKDVQNNKENNKDNGADKGDEGNDKSKDKDFEQSYKEIQEFVQDLSFEELQSNEEIQNEFYEYFHFYVKSKSVFRFIKFCFQYSEKPKNFGKNFSSILKTISNKKMKDIPDDYYTKFITKVSGKNKKDFGIEYKQIQQFLQDVTFEDLQTEENMETFYSYFNFNVESEVVFKLIKECFRSPKKPVGFDTNFSSIWNIIINTSSQVIDKYYTTFINIIFGKNSNNKGDNKDSETDHDKPTNKNNGDNDYNTNYQQINQFLTDMSFEEVQNEENMQIFYSYFNFYVESESVYNFVKFCFQDSEQPSNFGINFSAFLNMILNSNMDEIPKEYYTIFTNNLSIFKNVYKFNYGANYESIYKFLIDMSFAKLQTNANWEKFYSFFNFYPVSEDMMDFIKYCFQYSEKPANLETNFQTVINAIFKSNFDITQQFYIQFAKNLFGESQMNYKNNYDAVFQFMKDLTFEDAQAGDNWDTFYYYFQCYPTPESLFNFFKYCYQYEQKPTNFDVNFASVLNAIFSATSDDVSDDLYNLFTKNLFGDDDDSNNKPLDFGKNYVDIYKFLVNLKFDDIQTDENSQKFYSIFNLKPESESMFEFFKYCFQYADKPANFEANFAKAMNAILSSDMDEVPTHFYTQFAKNLFGGQNQFYKGRYADVHKFMKDLKFEDMDKPDNWDRFYYYFECYPVSESLFEFIKFCFRYEVEPVNFQTNFPKCLTIIFDSDDDEVSNDLYITYIKNLFNGNIYKAIHNFMGTFTYEEATTSFLREVYHYYFQFYPQSESLYKFMKYCFQYDDKPVNFDKNFQTTLGAYMDSGKEEVSDDLYEKFKINLFGGEGQNEWYDFGFNKMFNKDDEDQNDQGGNSSGDSGSDNGNSGQNDQGGSSSGYSGSDSGNSWSYSWSSNDQGGSSNDNSGNDQNNNQYSEWYYYN